MSMRWKIIVGLVALAVAWSARLTWDYLDPNSIAHMAMQQQLKLFGSAMYEYHLATGRWPQRLDDLERTSLPLKNHLWRETAPTIVLLWPQDLRPDPNDNAGVLLAYRQAGLFNRLGRVWVCWGDLRTEHIPQERLRTLLTR
jgi:hypothetical protein